MTLVDADERRDADPPFSVIGVCDRLGGTVGDEGGVRGGCLFP